MGRLVRQSTVAGLVLVALLQTAVADGRTAASTCALDEVQLETTESPRTTRLVLGRLDTTGVDRGTGGPDGERKLVRLVGRVIGSAPEALRLDVTERLGDASPFDEIVGSSGDATAATAVLDGRFTVLDPGRYRDDRPTRVGIEGTISVGDRPVGRFKHLLEDGRNWGTLRTRFDGLLDTLADDLATFLGAWARGDHAASCSIRRIGVLVSGETAPDLGTLSIGTKLNVYENPDPSDPIGQREMAMKISSVLAGRGFKLTEPDDADFSVLFDFGTTKERSGDRTLFRSGLNVSVAVTESLGDGPVGIVWKGRAELTDTHDPNPERPLEIMDLLVVALLDRFGFDTAGRSERSFIMFNDPRAETLRRRWRLFESGN